MAAGGGPNLMGTGAGGLVSDRWNLTDRAKGPTMQREQRTRRERRAVGGVKQLPWRTHRNPYKPIEVLTEEQIERIHDASMRILEEFGIEFLDAQARDRAVAKGAELVPGTQRLRFDRHLVAEYVGKAPAEFTL
ncbi:MAG TPA: trimethylamine methyltransferase family protein, partial [Dongiaceae bacterium]